MGARRKYRWEEWLTQPYTVLVRGIDYDCSQSCMTQSIRNKASKIGVRVSITDNRDSIEIRIVNENTHPDKVGVSC